MKDLTVAGTFLRELKDATNEQHLALEADPLLASLLSPTLTRTRYLSYLQLFSKVVAAYSSHILPLSRKVLTGWNVTDPLVLIEKDLEVLGCDGQSDEIIPYQLPAAAINVPQALGFTYVMEGSKLGGKVIARSLHKHLKLTETNGASYLSDLNADTFPLWKSFTEKFSSYIVFTDAQQDAIRGANDAFASIANFLKANSAYYEL